MEPDAKVAPLTSPANHPPPSPQVLQNMIVPPGIGINKEDFTYDIPPSWEYDNDYAFRNDIHSLVRHNMAVGLSKSRQIETVEDLKTRVAQVSWGFTKAVGAALLVIRVVLNVYSATANVSRLPARDADEEYNLSRYFVFLYEALMVGLQLILFLFNLAAASLTGVCMTRKLRDVKDVVTGRHFDSKPRIRRRQAMYLRYAGLFMERTAAFSVMRYLPSTQVIMSLVSRRKELVIAARAKFLKFKAMFEDCNRAVAWIVFIIALPVWIACMLGLLALFVGPYLLSPIALVIKIRFQIEFVVSTYYDDWALAEWFRMAAFINSVASAVNVEEIRQEVVMDHLATGADAKYSPSELELLKELNALSFQFLWERLGVFRAFFMYLSLSSTDLQRMTKKPGPVRKFRPYTVSEALEQGLPVPEPYLTDAAKAKAKQGGGGGSGGGGGAEGKVAARSALTEVAMDANTAVSSAGATLAAPVDDS